VYCETVAVLTAAGAAQQAQAARTAVRSCVCAYVRRSESTDNSMYSVLVSAVLTHVIQPCVLYCCEQWLRNLDSKERCCDSIHKLSSSTHA
jgi:hypothetical protein